MKRRYGSDVTLVSCVTDISDNAEWINTGTDCYLVGSESVREALVRKGVRAQDILPAGIPVRRGFSPAAYRVSDGESRLLVMGGADGCLPRGMGFYQQLAALPGVRTTVLTGGNRVLYRKLQGRFATIEAVEYTDDVAHYMRRSDAILTKPGGVSVFEAIRVNCPLLLLPAKLSQERANAAFVESRRMGRVLSAGGAAIAAQIGAVLSEGETLRGMRENMRAFSSGLDGAAFDALLARPIICFTPVAPQEGAAIGRVWNAGRI